MLLTIVVEQVSSAQRLVQDPDNLQPDINTLRGSPARTDAEMSLLMKGRDLVSGNVSIQAHHFR